jgi:hypothetical protein
VYLETGSGDGALAGPSGSAILRHR